MATVYLKRNQNAIASSLNQIFLMMSSEKGSLRDVAVILNREKLSQKRNGPADRTLLFIGSKHAGKTSIIHQVIEKDRETSPSSTYLLEYKYARQSGKSLAKDVCHVWELGCGTTFASLLSVFGDLKQNNALCVVLVVDLSMPETILRTADVLLDNVRTALKHFPTNEDESSLPRSINIVEEEDKSYLNPFPVALVIIGGKYDLFQNMEPTKKRVICQYLRCLAHILQADLLFYSNSDTLTVKKIRDILLHYGFGSSEAKGSVVTDTSKPLRILAGQDSFRSIQDSKSTTINCTLDKYKEALLVYSNFQKTNEEQVPDDPASDMNFEEPSIDNLCQQKTEELKRVKEMILASKLANKKPRI